MRPNRIDMEDCILITHPAMAEHGVPAGHPERPARLASVLEALRPLGLAETAAPRAERDALARAHTPAFISALDVELPAPGGGVRPLDAGDTFVDGGSREAAYRAAGACVEGVDWVLEGRARTAFCAVRPPGHHAEPSRAMGFCLFNNVAVAAKHALDAHGLDRVAILDFDVHHGNGSQAIAEEDPRIVFVSSHGAPLYPGSGFVYERGRYDTVRNAPLPPGSDGTAFREAWSRDLFPKVEAFAPQLILVSAGFDAHSADPLAPLELDESDFAWIGGEIAALAARVCAGRVVSTLEGGYDLQALGRSAASYVAAMVGGEGGQSA